MQTPPSLASIRQFLPISEQLATAGQPTEDQFAAIAEAGYEVVINLALPTSDHALAHEPALVESLGLSYIAIPVVWEQPSQVDLARFFAAIAAHAGQKTFVHCAANMRVSAFVYLYRRLQLGVSEAEAQQDLHRIWQPNPIWQQFIEQAISPTDSGAAPPYNQIA